MKRLGQNALLILVVLGCGIRVLAHDDIATALFVGIGGIDGADCDERAAPCASLRHALSMATPGQNVRVAAGVYDVAALDPETYLWGINKAFGGFSRADNFAQQDSERNATYLVGLDARYRTVVEARGFKLLKAGPASAPALQAAAAAPSACVQGQSGPFPCRGFDFAAQIPLSGFSSQPSSASNLWGFVDLNDNREYIVIGLRNATSVVDVTDAANPRQVGAIPGNVSAWREVKILQVRDAAANRYRAYAYISTEAPGSGIQVIDLSGLPNAVALATTVADTSSQHTLYVSNVDYATNLALPGATPFLFVAGSNLASGAWRAYSLANPAAPRLAGTAPAGSGYMHDSVGLTITDNRTTQCSAGHNPCEILADFNVTTVDLWDVTDKSAPLRLSSTSYPTVNYTHSGWPTADGRFLFVHDELDEIQRGINTQIYTLDLGDLRAPRVVTSFTGPNTATDHNGYVKGSRLYVSHYRRGLVVFDATNPNALQEIGYFDTFLNPVANTAGTDGAWGVYPFLPSGTIAISDIDNGLFLVKDRLDAALSAGRLGFTDLALDVSEAVGSITIRVRRVGGSFGAVGLTLATRDGTATAGSDYTATSTALSWSDGDFADRTVTIPITNDAQNEPDETFAVVLSALSGGAALDGAGELTVTLRNDDAAPPSPPAASGSGGGGSLDGTILLLLLGLLWARHVARKALPQLGSLRYGSGRLATTSGDHACLKKLEYEVCGCWRLPAHP